MCVLRMGVIYAKMETYDYVLFVLGDFRASVALH